MSLSRFPLALMFVTLFRAEPGPLLTASILIAAVAQATDHLDGYFIRRSGEPSIAGWLFDSVSDRAFYIGAVLAFQREYGFSEIITWAFVMREIALYAMRLVTGDFERARPGFRRLALVHAGIVRIAIVIGCIAPLGLLPDPMQAHAAAILSAIILAATLFGSYCLLLLRPRG